ncbi:GSAP protein, partial [Polypterus senegalus]
MAIPRCGGEGTDVARVQRAPRATPSGRTARSVWRYRRPRDRMSRPLTGTGLAGVSCVPANDWMEAGPRNASLVPKRDPIGPEGMDHRRQASSGADGQVLQNLDCIPKDKVAEDFSWVQWDAQTQMLHLLFLKDNWILKCYQFYPDRNFDVMVPLDLPVKPISKGRLVNFGHGYCEENETAATLNLRVFTSGTGQDSEICSLSSKSIIIINWLTEKWTSNTNFNLYQEFILDTRVVPLFQEEDNQQRVLIGLIVDKLRDHLNRHFSRLGKKKIDMLALNYVAELDPPKLLDIMSSLYTGTVSAVQRGGRTFVFFPVDSGVHHGCALAPILFSACRDWVFGRVMGSSSCGAAICEERLIDFDFADSALIFAESMEDLIGALEKLSEESVIVWAYKCSG